MDGAWSHDVKWNKSGVFSPMYDCVEYVNCVAIMSLGILL